MWLFWRANDGPPALQKNVAFGPRVASETDSRKISRLALVQQEGAMQEPMCMIVIVVRTIGAVRGLAARGRPDGLVLIFAD